MQALVCSVPAATLLAMGSAQLAGWVFWVTLAVLALRLLLSSRVDELLCLVLAVAPLVNFLRGFAFYNVVGALYGGAVFFGSCGPPPACPRWSSGIRSFHGWERISLSTGS